MMFSSVKGVVLGAMLLAAAVGNEARAERKEPQFSTTCKDSSSNCDDCFFCYLGCEGDPTRNCEKEVYECELKWCATTAEGEGDRYPEPRLESGYRLDWCYTWGTNCGAPAAHEFCERTAGPGWIAQDFAKDDDIGLTQVIGSSEVCNAPDCDGFSFVQCADTRLTTVKPTFKGYRLDYCRFWGKSCGRPAADAWCRYTNGTGWYAVDYKPESDIGPTRVIANSKICNASWCDGFAEITCAFDPPGQPDLIPVQEAAGFCNRDYDGLIATVKNKGPTAAGASTTRVVFSTLQGNVQVNVVTPALAPGEEVDLTGIEIPGSCFIPDCDFSIQVDVNDDVGESDEDSNVAGGTCF